MGGSVMGEPANFYIITDVPATLVMPDDTERAFTFESPNDREYPYEMILEPVSVQPDYEDANFQYTKGHTKWRFRFILRYDHHRMEAMPIALAKQVKLKVPVYLYRDSRYYQEFTCTRPTAQITRRSRTSSHGRGVGSKANRVANGPETFEFISQTYEWDEVEDLITFINPVTPYTDEGEELTGFGVVGETADGLGLIIKAYAPATFLEEPLTVSIGNLEFTYQVITLNSY